MKQVTNIAIAGYGFGSGKTTTGSVSGTFDALETASSYAWANLFGTAPAPQLGAFVPNVAFLPFGADPNGILNARLVRNLPLTIIATPAPLAPQAPNGSPPPPTPPATRLAECQSSSDHMLISSRVSITSTSSDLSRAIVAGGSLKWSQPEWNVYYTSAGLLAGLFFNPNGAQVAVDVFVCPPQSYEGVFNYATTRPDGKPATVVWQPNSIYQVGGIGHHIVGMHVAYSTGADPFAQQRAQDLALVDLENQLDCIISQERARMGVSLDAQRAKGLLDPLADSDWCKGSDASEYPRHSYFAHLQAVHQDELITVPADAGIF